MQITISTLNKHSATKQKMYVLNLLADTFALIAFDVFCGIALGFLLLLQKSTGLPHFHQPYETFLCAVGHLRHTINSE